MIIIALSGKKKSGKTAAFIDLSKMIQLDCNFYVNILIPIPKTYKIDVRYDFILVCEIYNKRVGLLSRCDIPKEYEKNIKELIRLNCAIILTVVHTPRSKSWKILSKYNNNIDIVDIKYVKQDPAIIMFDKLKNVL